MLSATLFTGCAHGNQFSNEDSAHKDAQNLISATLFCVMAKLPVVAIIGRPNTGKSTLFNRLIGERKSIESDIPGTTRDHISHRVSFGGIPALLLDTGGIGASRDTDFEESVAEQSMLALEHADVILFTINGREDRTKDDETIIKALRTKKRKDVAVMVLITKVDTPGTEQAVLADFADLGIGDSIRTISAPHRLGIVALTEEIGAVLRERHFVAEEELSEDERTGPPKIAIIGKPNVGKSSIVNALMSDETKKKSPLVVSNIAGTTRDATDTEITFQGRVYTLIDTAGIKKNSQRLDELERFAMFRTITAIERSDVVLLVLDAGEKISQQDKRIAALAIEHGKGLIILLNKIDQLSGKQRTEKVELVFRSMPFCTKFAKIIPCSAHTREGLVKIFDVIDTVQSSRTRRISVKELRNWFDSCIHGQPLGAVAKTKHLTQASDIPPTFVLFVRNPKEVKVTQLRYLENRLRETFGFDGTPIRWILKPTQRDQDFSS